MNYGALKSAIASWLMGRTDLDPVIPTFVLLTEARLHRELRVRQMLKAAIGTLVEGSFIPLPDDWLEAKNIQFNAGTNGVQPLTYVSLQEADKIRAAGSTTTRFYTIHAEYLEIVPPVSEEWEIELTYYAKLPTLTDDADTNWLLQTWPDIYLYGALLQSAPYLYDDERTAIWAGMFERLLEEARLQDARAEVSGSTPRARFRAIG